MPDAQPKFDINLLKSSTIEVFKDCLMPNGCIVAAPSHMPYYPRDAKSYLYCWPGRDTGFNLAAMLLLGQDYYDVFLRWLLERAEDFAWSEKSLHEGLIYRSYFPNGLVREHQFQPDQGATLIWSIKFRKDLTKQPLSDLEQIIISRIAKSYIKIWGDNGFQLPTQDIWEEKILFPGDGHFTYSLASCVHGLQLAGEMLNDPAFTQLSEKMKMLLMQPKPHLTPLFGTRDDSEITVDASLLGLAWPFNIGYKKEELSSILVQIEDQLLVQEGVYRYLEDKYEGRASIHQHNEKAGTWPLLTFWLAIAWNELGDKQRAERYFALNFKYLQDKYIPEQFFINHPNKWVGVKPLLWSHSMGILAAWKLGILK